MQGNKNELTVKKYKGDQTMLTLFKKLKPILLLGLILLLSLSPPVLAKETHFTDPGNWSDEWNWDNGLPEENDDVYIDADCTVDFWSSIPTLNSLTINALLDDLNDYVQDFWVNGSVTINNGGEFLCGGDLYISSGQLWIDGGGSGKFYGDVDVGEDIVIQSTCYFYGPVDVTGDLNIGGEDELIEFTATFNEKVDVGNNLEVGLGDNWSKAIFNEKLTCAITGNVDIYTELTFKDTLIAGDINIKYSGVLNAYADMYCYNFEIESSGSFNSYVDSTYTIYESLDLNGNFKMSKGTFYISPKFTSAYISPAEDCYFHNLTIAGGKTTYISMDNPNDPDTLDVNGNLTIESGATLNVREWTTWLAGNFYCNGTYAYYSDKTPNFIFDGNGTQYLTGSPDFYDLTIVSTSTVNTGTYTPTVSPNSLTENGYLVGHISTSKSFSDDATYHPGNLGMQITNGAGLGNTTITRHTGSTHSEAPHSLTRWYTVNANAADNNVTLRLYYRDSELNSNIEANLNIWRRVGSTWQKFTPTTRDASNNFVEATVDIPSGTSEWIISDAESDQSLPVDLISFSALPRNNQGILLTWQVGYEIQNSGYEIWKKAEEDSEDYQKIAFVKGAGTISHSKSYQYLDEVVVPEKSYSYRLYSVSFLGKKKLLSSLNGIRIQSNPEPSAQLPGRFQLFQNIPNPFNQSTLIPFMLYQPADITITIYDATGRQIRELHPGILQKGSHSLRWDGKDDRGQPVSSGVYIYRLRTSTFDAAARKMVLVR